MLRSLVYDMYTLLDSIFYLNQILLSSKYWLQMDTPTE
jgi:hypothetical protein